jgi:hypothetical protein
VALLCTFLVLSSILWLPLSLRAHRLTFSPIGSIGYTVTVSLKHQFFPFMQNNPDGTRLLHPVRIISENPVIYEFGEPIQGTYPYFYDSAYWLEGLHAPFSFYRQMTTIILNLQEFIFVLFQGFCPFLLVLLALSFLRKSGHLAACNILWEMVMPSMLGLALYWLTFIGYRYTVVFIWVLIFTYFLGLVQSSEGYSIKIQRCLGYSLSIVCLILLFGQSIEDLRTTLRHKSWAQITDNPHAEASRALHDLGAKEGAHLACVGPEKMFGVYFPQLARVTFGAAVEDESAFWRSPEEEKSKIYDLLRGTGATGLMAQLPAGEIIAPSGWRSIGKSGFIFHSL